MPWLEDTGERKKLELYQTGPGTGRESGYLALARLLAIHKSSSFLRITNLLDVATPTNNKTSRRLSGNAFSGR
uniref:Transposase n=1 Tax=Steinernema glaseri TaxID=37863 RepID=A0A1I7ZWF7_9BILA